MKRFFVPYVLLPLSVATFGTGLYPGNVAQAADPKPELPAADTPAPAVATTAPESPVTDAQIPALRADVPAPAATTADPDPRQVECMAKVIVHEAGNQGRRGQMAVAQVIRTRLQRSGAGADVCQIVKQRGQFFNVDRYSPERKTATWKNAVAIATATLRGRGEDVVPGALFFRAAGHPMRGRVRVAQIENQVFYR
jgi:spore germination cell wall hydrolase CwlJ-like protein